jgi:hypothetical protein
MRLDVFMIKFDEEGADAHWARLRAIAPHAILIEGVSGIRAAHAECARRASTSHFFVVDADNWLLDRFSFKLTFQPRDDEVAVWRAKNPINGLVYGHGGIKLLATEAFCGVKHVKEPSVDVATSLTHRYRKIPVLASEHRFNTTPLLTWRSAFRECAKLATYSGREAALRLAAWCSIVNAARHSTWCLQGACDGRDYGRKNIGSPEKMNLVNDYRWLQSWFIEQYGRTIALAKGSSIGGNARRLVLDRSTTTPGPPLATEQSSRA